MQPGLNLHSSGRERDSCREFSSCIAASKSSQGAACMRLRFVMNKSVPTCRALRLAQQPDKQADHEGG